MASCVMTSAADVAKAFHNLFQVEVEGVEFLVYFQFFAKALSLYFQAEISESVVMEASVLIGFAPTASTTQQEFGAFLKQLQQLLVPCAAAAPHMPATPTAVPPVTATPCWQPPQDFQHLPGDEALAVHAAIASFSSEDAQMLHTHIESLSGAHLETLQAYAEACM